jgi:hypothetical protein
VIRDCEGADCGGRSESFKEEALSPGWPPVRRVEVADTLQHTSVLTSVRHWYQKIVVPVSIHLLMYKGRLSDDLGQLETSRIAPRRKKKVDGLGVWPHLCMAHERDCPEYADVAK